MAAPKTDHRYLDEAGDTTFYGKGKHDVIGHNGVSLTFSIGMLKIKGDHDALRQRVVELQNDVANDDYVNSIPSVAKKIKRGGYFFHATDDPQEIRQTFFKFIKSQNVTLEMFVGRKEVGRYERNHQGKESEFYADMLSHLIKSKLRSEGKLVLNIAERGTTTRNVVLQNALAIAKQRASYKLKPEEMRRDVTFNVQNQHSEPLLNVADYLCWAVQRVFEKGDLRYYNFMKEKISSVVDVYDKSKYERYQNYYGPKNPLTIENKISPPCT